MNIYPASPATFSEAVSLLKKNNLPTEDLSDHTEFFILQHEGYARGTIALEYEGEDGLLRSLAVADQYRKMGYGEQLVYFLEQYCKQIGVRHLYLLTETAGPFFRKRGYEQIERNSVSPFIKKTSEYSSVCPASSAVMKKEIA
jgi:amino-acid N-acetyltransferase